MKLLLGVCGSIAAYKAAELVRLLQDQGPAALGEPLSIEVALTAAAERFVTPLTFNALTGRRVHTSLWSPDQASEVEGPIEHISVAGSSDALLIAPASATTLARLAHGFADDFLSAVALATRAPLLLAPAMNVNMWQHPATQAHLALLEQRGATILAPDAGYLACGLTGSGRLAELQTIVAATLSVLGNNQNGSSKKKVPQIALASGTLENVAPSAISGERVTPAANVPSRSSFTVDLLGETVLITAGGTREPLDPVRFLGNRSSGRMGHALAEAALARGARVVLITASSLPVDPQIDPIRVDTAQEMADALALHLANVTLVFGAAAVADFRPHVVSSGKLRRGEGPLLLKLEPTPDLMAYAATHRRPGTLIIAFAAETENLESNGRLKLKRKGVDAVVANDISRPDSGFDAEQNAGLFLTKDETTPLSLTSKREMADTLLTQALQLRSRPTQSTRQDGTQSFQKVVSAH